MRKRWMSLALAACMMICLAACGSNGSDTKADSGEEKEGGLKAVLIGNQRFGDNGPMDDMASGGERAAEEFGMQFKKIESESASFEEDIRAMSEEGYDLIITTFNYMSDATALVAAEFPDRKYAAIFQELNSEGGEKIENLWDAVFRGQTTFYVDGYMAGLATRTNQVGFIVGGEEPGPNAEANGFMRGVRDANPDAEVQFSYASYEDSAKAKEVALAMIDKGCDIIQGDCAAPDAGIIEAAGESGKDVFVMSCIMDFSEDSKNFVGTIKMNYGQAVYDVMKSLSEGNFPGGEQGVRDITNQGYYLDWEIYDSFASRTENQEYAKAFTEAIKAGKELEQQIKDGDLEIEFDPSAPDWNRIKAE
jgi:Uncharacterized ABC-type transport system, periplasmic component/surface lipoprotein